ncbi:hypothetical protein ACFFMN_25385 [Planobispora siamensis]|nr:hypothetical protein [Planobispora siamensis]
MTLRGLPSKADDELVVLVTPEPAPGTEEAVRKAVRNCPCGALSPVEG